MSVLKFRTEQGITEADLGKSYIGAIELLSNMVATPDYDGSRQKEIAAIRDRKSVV